ncbi:putative Nucleoside-diphosphate-sugar epimerase [Seiridium cardinale]|uniref:Nucleoside-diphosphate-sugar epimerase n=1 Tax=Seiridium cardinale TaxID=138064 RepID=A0ABR2Y9F8_9PEZI
MHVILTGATGLVGSGVLDAMINMKDITKISILARRPVQLAEDAKDPRINVIIHKDFEKYDAELLEKLQGARGCVWALGISQTQVGAEEYVKITKTFTLEAAKAFQSLASDEQPFNFVYVSGAGATTEPGRFTQIFARVKGETELALAELRKQQPSFRASSARPAYVDASAHDAIKPYLPNKPFPISLLKSVVGGPIRFGLKSFHSPTEPLGRALTGIAMGRYQDRLVAGKGIHMIGQFPILENSVLKQVVGLH